jgi:hypothetical protein
MSDGPLDGARAARVSFLDYHRPAMPPGQYTIEVAQEVSGPGVGPETFTTSRRFTVAGERFTLRPADVYAVFPPEGSLGDHSDVLPHIVLNRSTMPWEYRADGGDTPWLALLLFTEEDGAGQRYRPPEVTTLGTLEDATSGPVHWPGLRYDPDQYQEGDKVTVIDVQRQLLATLLPSAGDLSLLTHVRRAEDAGGRQVGDELAVVIGSRLPPAGGISVVHLVSMQDRYTAGGQFDFGAAGTDEYVRLVSLKEWRFACADPAGDFAGLLTGLDRTSTTLRLPHHSDQEAERFLSAGTVPLPHHLPTGNDTVSWYHGPLIPGIPPDELDLPAPAAAALTRYHPSLGMFDVSYAAAWQLGRLLALQSSQLSTSLYNWKRAHTQASEAAETWLLHPGWVQPDAGADTLPPDVVDWFGGLRLLRGIPFHYLVPDERMLPPESIRFCQLDQVWVDCLVDGAFSLGRLTGRLKPADRRQQSLLVGAVPAHDTVSGFLLRSSVVSGWPGLIVDGYAGGRSLTALRQDRLSPDVLLCLFAGELARVEIHQQPQTLHFGTAELTDEPDGGWRGPDGVVNIDRLVQLLRTGPSFTAADFAARTVEGVPRVTFLRS